MSHKEVDVQWYVLFIFSLLVIFYVFKSVLLYTGFVVYPETSAEKVWGFDTASDYIYSSYQINLNDGKVQLLSTTTSTTTTINEINVSTLVAAVEYNSNNNNNNNAVDRTSQVNSLGSGLVELNSKSVLEIKLNKQIANNNFLSLYLLSGNTGGSKIYLCKNNVGCNNGEYGNTILPTTFVEGWYNITISEMPAANDTFFIASPDKIKIDLVQGYVKSSRTEIVTSTSYPSSSSIETADFQLSNWKSWGTFSKTEQLNGQTVNYLYSTNSGSSWAAIPVNLSFNAVAGSKIRFKVELNSNTTATPVVDTLTLAYTTQQVCAENWSCTSWNNCTANSTQSRSCTDANSCGTTTSKPAEMQSCTYVVPCTENWNTQYGNCLKNDSKLKYYIDAGECGAVSTLPLDNNTYIGCDYCAQFNCSGSALQMPIAEIKENKTIYLVDAQNTANTQLEIESGAAPASIEIVEYAHNIKNETPSVTPINRYIDLQSDEKTISSVKIIIYYQDSEITALDENMLKIYYYNETSKIWDALSSTVNVSGNYVSATVPHLSLYGLFGEPLSSASAGSPSASGSGGGGGGGGVSGKRRSETATIISNSLTAETIETILPTKSEPESTLKLNAPVSEASCEYVVEISLPDEIVLGEDDLYEGEITNKGNCGIPELKLGLSPELDSRVGLSTLEFSDIRPGDKKKFILIRKKVTHDDLFSATSYVVGSLKPNQNVLGQVTLQGYDETGEIFMRELPVSLLLKNSFPWKELVMGSLIMMVMLIFAVQFWSVRGVKKKKKG